MGRGHGRVFQLPDVPGRSRRRPRSALPQADARSPLEAAVGRAKCAADPVCARRVARRMVLGRALSRLFCRQRIRRPRAQPSGAWRKRRTSRLVAVAHPRLRRRCRGRCGDIAGNSRHDRSFDGGYVLQKYLETQSSPAAFVMASVPPTGAWPMLLRLTEDRPLDVLKASATLSLFPIVSDPAKAHELLFSPSLPRETVVRYQRLLQEEFSAELPR